jgi:hypothetical protein
LGTYYSFCGRRKAKKFPLLKLSSPLPVAKEKKSFGFRNPDARSKEEPIKKLPKGSLRDRGLNNGVFFREYGVLGMIEELLREENPEKGREIERYKERKKRRRRRRRRRRKSS